MDRDRKRRCSIPLSSLLMLDRRNKTGLNKSPLQIQRLQSIHERRAQPRANPTQPACRCSVTSRFTHSTASDKLVHTAMDAFALPEDTVISASDSTAGPIPLPPLVHKHHLSSTATRSSIKRRKLLEPVSSPGSPMSTSSVGSVTPSTKSSSSRPNMTASSSITLDMLRPHFEEPLAKVAASFGICVTLLKKICRRHGIARWPHRQITGLRKSIASMEHAIGYFDGARRESYAEQLLKQKNKLAALLEDPTTKNPLLATEEDQRVQNAKRQTNVSLLQGADNVYEEAPAIMTRASSPTGPLLLEPPFDGASSGAMPLQALPVWFPTIETSYTQQYQELCPPPTLKQSHREFYPTPNYCLPSVSNNGSTSTIYLPPLRPESREVLPPISSLVVSNNNTYTSAMPTASW